MRPTTGSSLGAQEVEDELKSIDRWYFPECAGWRGVGGREHLWYPED